MSGYHFPWMIRASKTLAQFLEGYRGSQLRIADGTREQMAIAVRLFDRHVGHPVLLLELTETLLVDFLADYSTRVSAATVNAKRRSILALWTEAARHQLVPAPDRLRVPKAREPRRIPEAWTVEEVSRLVRTARSMRGRDIGRISRGRWFSSLIRVLWESSSRVSAMLSIRPLDCHLDERYLIVRAEQTKTGMDQLYWLSTGCTDAIAEIYDPHAAAIWDWPYSKRQFFKTFRSIAEGAGLRSDPTLAMQLSHKLRRSALTQVAMSSGLDRAREQAGHSSAAMTRRHYIDPRLLRDRSAVDALPQLELDDDPQLRLF